MQIPIPDIVTVIIKTINNVSGYGQTREGRLRIGISIPAGLCISNPKVLIDELEMAFKSQETLIGDLPEIDYESTKDRAILR